MIRKQNACAYITQDNVIQRPKTSNLATCYITYLWVTRLILQERPIRICLANSHVTTTPDVCCSESEYPVSNLGLHLTATSELAVMKVSSSHTRDGDLICPAVQGCLWAVRESLWCRYQDKPKHGQSRINKLHTRQHMRTSSCVGLCYQFSPSASHFKSTLCCVCFTLYTKGQIGGWLITIHSCVNKCMPFRSRLLNVSQNQLSPPIVWHASPCRYRIMSQQAVDAKRACGLMLRLSNVRKLDNDSKALG